MSTILQTYHVVFIRILSFPVQWKDTLSSQSDGHNSSIHYHRHPSDEHCASAWWSARLSGTLDIAAGSVSAAVINDAQHIILIWKQSEISVYMHKRTSTLMWVYSYTRYLPVLAEHKYKVTDISARTQIGLKEDDCKATSW